MSVDEVMTQIRQLLHDNENPLSKKAVKKIHPELFRNALFYFPSWEHAIQNTDQLT